MQRETAARPFLGGGIA
jgi:hypothetical protein